MAAANPVPPEVDTSAEEPTEVGKPAKATKPLFTLKPSKQTCIGLAALIGVTLLSAGGLYAWQSQELAILETAANTEKGKVESSEMIANRQARVADEYRIAQGQIRTLETSVSQNEYIPTLLKQVEDLGKSTNLTVDSVRPTFEPSPLKKAEPRPAPEEGKPDPPKIAVGTREWPYDKVHVDVQVRGAYWNIARLLYRLNDFPKILAVEGVTMQPHDPNLKANTTPQLTVNLKVTGFIFPKDGEPMMNPNLLSPAVAAGGAPAASAASAAPGSPGSPGAKAGTVTTASGQSVPAPPTRIPGAGAANRLHAQQNEVINDR